MKLLKPIILTALLTQAMPHAAANTQLPEAPAQSRFTTVKKIGCVLGALATGTFTMLGIGYISYVRDEAKNARCIAQAGLTNTFLQSNSRGRDDIMEALNDMNIRVCKHTMFAGSIATLSAALCYLSIQKFRELNKKESAEENKKITQQ